MAKKSRKRLPRHERSEPGCMWTLMSLFDFRQGRSTKRLITNSHREAKQGIGRSNSQKILPRPAAEVGEDILDIEESRTPPASVKELMAVEMFKDQGFMDKSNDWEAKLDEMALKQAKRNQKKKKKRNRFKSSDMDVMELDAVEFLCENFSLVPEQMNADNLDLEMVVDKLVRISQRDTTRLNDNSHDAADVCYGQDVEKLVAALKLVLKERRSGKKYCEEGGDVFQSEEFMDAQQMLSSNRGSFLKLLQDQNSVLVKNFPKLVDAHLDNNPKTPLPSAADLHEENPVSLKPGDLSSQKHWNFFRRSRSLDSYPTGWDKDCLSPNKIVILRPGREGAQRPEHRLSVSSSSSLDNKSYFSFTGIKRKLWNAMGRERQAFPSSLKLPPKQRNGKSDCKIWSPGESSGWSSPNRDHFYTERFAISSPLFKRGEVAGKSRDKSSLVLAAETFQYRRLRGPKMYNEAKKHLSDMLKNQGQNIESVEGQFSKSLGRTLSFIEYSESPCRSPRTSSDNGLASDPRKLNLESPCSSSLDNITLHADLSLKVDLKCSSEVGSLAKDTEAHEVWEIDDKAVSRYQEVYKVTDGSSSNSFDADMEKGDFGECLQDELPPCIKVDLLSERQSSPSSSQARSRAEECDYAFDKMERPSPVSVLEPLFTDDNVSPASTSLAQPAEKDIQPRHIQFEEHSSPTEPGICLRISLEDEESAFEYVEAVLLGSGLNLDEFLLRWLSEHDILDSSLFDEVELFSSRPRHDQKLLFDCANIALKETCESYFRCFPSLSGAKTDIRPLRGMELIQEIWKQVEAHLLPHLWSHSLHQLIKSDLDQSRNWIKLVRDVHLICFVIGETILDELAEDSLLILLEAEADDTFA